MSIAIKAASVLLATAALCGAGAGVAAAATPATVHPTPYVLSIGPAAGHGPVRPMDLSDPHNVMITIVALPDGLIGVTVHDQPGLDGATVVANDSAQTLDVSLSHHGTVLDQAELGAGARLHVSVQV